ncbi:hypothetical protein [Scytonema sp. UIC 10036]|uniref:hypothetical protein n=1 Tax=Scytonema sp. UIC 10036 TaxID=2304196 RepID=UPI001FAA1F74|nr:hypothetical protein [Scytonema sp. UIC 10036]
MSIADLGTIELETTADNEELAFNLDAVVDAAIDAAIEESGIADNLETEDRDGDGMQQHVLRGITKPNMMTL